MALVAAPRGGVRSLGQRHCGEECVWCAFHGGSIERAAPVQQMAAAVYTVKRAQLRKKIMDRWAEERVVSGRSRRWCWRSARGPLAMFVSMAAALGKGSECVSARDGLMHRRCAERTMHHQSERVTEQQAEQLSRVDVPTGGTRVMAMAMALGGEPLMCPADGRMKWLCGRGCAEPWAINGVALGTASLCPQGAEEH